MSTTTTQVKSLFTPSPSTLKIINLPTRRRHTRRRKPRTTVPEVIQTYNYKGKLERLFGEDREFSRAPVAEEMWRFEAEKLRAECDALRMENMFVMKKLEKNGIGIETSVKSGLKTLYSGRKKLCEGENLEEEIKELSEKLEELESGYNGDRSTLTSKSQNKSTYLSKAKLDQMEKEYRSIINNSVAGSASTSNRVDFSDHLAMSNRFSNQAKEPLVSLKSSDKCSGRCKVLVRRMMEQVRAETEQWSQMQVMLGQLRQEMEELQTSKNFWETQALASNQEIQSLMIDVEEWREKAVRYETKADRLQIEVNLLKREVEKLKKDQVRVSLGKQIERERKIGLSCRMHEKVEQPKKDSQPLSLWKQLAMEKRILISQMKENTSNNKDEILSDGRRKGCHLVRSPFKEIGNAASSSMGVVRQNSNAIFPLHCHEHARMED
ncbi:hypothetical protein QVD17_40190 [Tagetes erecta]|uniref:Uncharacterized protein n=1 Tax=Tagetes erecta TaxID=13708 RepID=A0AAD8JPR4_TARER|nr:hypothetical protein QVD17_40190 [Tagetes erecta]